MAWSSEVVVIDSSDEEVTVTAESFRSHARMIISDEEDENDDKIIEISESSDDAMELPSAEDCIRYVPNNTHNAMEIETEEAMFTPPDTPPCHHEVTVKTEPTQLQAVDTFDQNKRPNSFGFRPVKKFKINISSPLKNKLENPVGVRLTQDEILQIVPPTCYRVSPHVDCHQTVCSFDESVVDYVESVSEINEYTTRFISPYSVPPIDLVMKLVSVVRDSTDESTSLTVYNLVRHSMVLLTPQPHQEDVWNVLDPTVYDIRTPGFTLSIDLILSIVEQLQRSQIGKPIFRPPDRWKGLFHKWKSSLCEWLTSTSMASSVTSSMMGSHMTVTLPCLPAVRHLLQLVTLYCTDCRDQSIRDGLASSWVTIYNVTRCERWRDLLQTIGDHEMRGLLLDKLLSCRFQRISDLCEADQVIWSSQPPSLSKTVYLHFYRQPHTDSSEYIMLLSYLLQSNIMSNLSTNYHLSIDTPRLTEECHKLKARLSMNDDNQFMLDLAVELAHTLSNS